MLILLIFLPAELSNSYYSIISLPPYPFQTSLSSISLSLVLFLTMSLSLSLFVPVYLLLHPSICLFFFISHSLSSLDLIRLNKCQI